YGRWWLVTPDGHPFYSSGIDHVSASPDVDQTTGQCPYCQAIAAEYPSVGAWATATVARLRSWGFNSLGPFSDDSTFSSQMPYSVQLSMAGGNDWFAPSFVTNADQVAASQVAPLAHDPNLIGYYTDSELHWGPDGSDTRPVLDNYLALPPGSPGLAVAQQYVNNPNGFVFALATRYFQVTTAAVRKYDPVHLILGVKAEAQEIQPELLEAARPYVDVFSIDDYQLQPGLAEIIDQIWPQYLPVTPTFSDFENYVQKPIMVGEYSFRALGSATPDTVPPVYATYATQPQRAAAYTDYVAPLYEDSRWVVGDEWFEYVDEPAGGRFDGENNNFGVVDVGDQPYPDLVTQMEIMHSIAPDRVAQPGVSCDSWAAGPNGVTCDALMSHATYPPSIATAVLPSGTQGKSYRGSVVAIGGRPGYSFSVAPTTPLPRGLRLDSRTGAVTRIPRVAGTFSFTVVVTDSSPTPLTSSASVSITIAPPSS
ncbi:MAG: Ig domain-containing protein, partial [Acidimicrobiales bacterium]